MSDDVTALALATCRRAYARQRRDLERTRADLRAARKRLDIVEARLPRLSEELMGAYADTIIAAETWTRRPSVYTAERIRDAVNRIHAAWIAADGAEEFER